MTPAYMQLPYSMQFRFALEGRSCIPLASTGFQARVPTCGPMDGCPFHQEVIPELPPVTRSCLRRCLLLSEPSPGKPRGLPRWSQTFARNSLVYAGRCPKSFSKMALTRHPSRRPYPLQDLSKRYHDESHPTATPRIVAK